MTLTASIRQFDPPPVLGSNDEVARKDPFELNAELENNATLLPRVPGDIQLGFLLDGRLRIHTPLHVRLREELSHVIAEATELNEFGFGGNFSEAIRDLQRAIAELYFTLQEDQSRLGSDLQQVWSSLQAAVLERKL